MLSVQNITAIVVILVFLVELYFCTAGSNHRRKRLLSGWNPVKGRIKTVEEKRDEIYHKKYIELTIEVGDGRLVYSKQNPMFCIYEEGEEVDLMENKGVHRFLGNDRVHQKGIKETLIGTIPMLVIVLIAIILSLVANMWS